jgi:hypothetical protein
MADLQSFSVTRLSNQNFNGPRWRIECRVVDSQTGVLIRDLTGANALIFPSFLGQLTQAQQDRIVELIVLELIERRLELA